MDTRDNAFVPRFSAIKQPGISAKGVTEEFSTHFNLTVELPLKAIVRGYSWSVAPITRRSRRTGEAKLKIREMDSRYLFIVLYVWLEKYFSRGDYRRKPTTPIAENVASKPAQSPHS